MTNKPNNQVAEIMARALNDKDPSTFDNQPLIFQTALKASARAQIKALEDAGFVIAKMSRKPLMMDDFDLETEKAAITKAQGE